MPVFFFAFLWVGEMTVPNNAAYDPKVHLGVENIAVDRALQPTIVRVGDHQTVKDGPLLKRGRPVCGEGSLSSVPCGGGHGLSVCSGHGIGPTVSVR